MAESSVSPPVLSPQRTLTFANLPVRTITHDNMVRPMYNHDFVNTYASKKVDEILETDAYAIILTGVPGTGKTFLAEEKSAEIWHDRLPADMPKFYKKFHCDTLESFFSDLNVFYRDLNMVVEAIADNKPRTWEIVQTLFETMNDNFPSHQKVFIFDDVEDLEELLKVMDHIGRKVRPRKSKDDLKDSKLLTGSWNIFVTSMKTVAIPRSYQYIGGSNFVSVEKFTLEETKQLFKFCELSDDSIKKLREILGALPLALRICMKSLASDETGDTGNFVDNYLTQVQNETKQLEKIGKATREKSPLIAIKIAIERLVGDLPYANFGKQLLKMLTFFSEKELSRELLVSCAETITTDELASEIVRLVMARLCERHICTKKLESRMPLYTLHKLVKQSLELFVEDEKEKVDLAAKALIGINRVVPKDGRKHQARLVGFYAEHGRTLDSFLSGLGPNQTTPFIKLLHCNLLVGLGYCLLSQRSGLDDGLKKLTEAQDKYCDLVMGNNYTYKQLVDEETVEESEVHKAIAKRLYEESLQIDLLEDPTYRSYVDELPQYHRLTAKDLDNMMHICKFEDLINGHLTRQKLEEFKSWGRSKGKETVLDIDTMARIYVAELLTQIYCVWSKIHGKKREYHTKTDECIFKSEAAKEVYVGIYEENGVFLLADLITEREMLAMKMAKASSAQKVNEILQQIENLSKVGEIEDKQFAYEAGLMRSDLSQDQYHKMVCVEWKINCFGRLYQLDDPSRRDGHYESGAALLGEVERLAKLQVYKDSALSYCYKNYAKFLSHCQKYGDAVCFVLRAMELLGKSLKNGANKSHPELESPRFNALYSDLEPYYEDYKKLTREADGNTKLLGRDSDEYEYLDRVVQAWREMGSKDKPTDADTKFEVLEFILEEHVQEEQVM